MAAGFPVPSSLPQATLLLLKRTLYHAILPHRVLFLATVAAVLALVHTYLLVVVNEGFNLSNPWMSEVLILPERLFRSSAMYLAGGFLAASTLRRAAFHPIQFPSDVLGLPLTIGRAARTAGGLTAILFPAGVAAGLAFGSLAQQRILQLELALILLLSVSLEGRSLIVALLRVLTEDLRRLLTVPVPGFRTEWFGVPASGIAAGLALTGIAPWMPWTGVVATLGALLLTALGTGAVVARRLALFALGIAVLASLGIDPALADDGGWVEGGGTLERWLGSDGAWAAIGIGFLPGIGTGIGWVIGIAIGDVDPSEWGLIPTEPEPAPEREEDPIEVEIRIERLYPDSPHVLSRGWRYRAEVEVRGGPPGTTVSAVHWSGAGCHFGSPVTGIRQWNAVRFDRAGPATLTASVSIDGQTWEAHTTDIVENIQGYARISDLAKCDSCAHGCMACPHSVIGPIITGSPTFQISGLAIARVGDRGLHAACCGANMYEIVEGDPNILIDGRPAARIGSKTLHCGSNTGRIVSGDPGSVPE